MHYLVIARVKDYPDVEEVMEALTYDYPAKDDYSGKWVKTYDTLEEFIADYKDEITESIDGEDFSFDEKVSEYMDSNGFRLGFDGKVYQKDSAHFDNCVFGGRYINKNVSCVVPYKTVIDEYADAAAYVLPGYKFYYTDDNKCPFAPDDLVYIIDGQN